MQFTGNSGAAPKGKPPPAYMHTKCKGIPITNSTQHQPNQLHKKKLLAFRRAVVHRSHTSNKSHHTYLTRNTSPMHPRRGCCNGMLLSHLPNDRRTPESISPTDMLQSTAQREAEAHSEPRARSCSLSRADQQWSGVRLFGNLSLFVQNESGQLSPVPAQIHTLDPTETQGFG